MHAGKLHKLRVLTDEVSFSESSARGTKRRFSAAAFYRSLRHFDRFLVADARTMPNSAIYVITKEQIVQWIQDRLISAQAVASRDVMLRILQS